MFNTFVPLADELKLNTCVSYPQFSRYSCNLLICTETPPYTGGYEPRIAILNCFIIIL